MSKEWKDSFQELEAISGFEPMHQDDIDSGDMSCEEAWSENISWLETMLADCMNINTPEEEE